MLWAATESIMTPKNGDSCAFQASPYREKAACFRRVFHVNRAKFPTCRAARFLLPLLYSRTDRDFPASRSEDWNDEEFGSAVRRHHCGGPRVHADPPSAGGR